MTEDQVYEFAERNYMRAKDQQGVVWHLDQSDI